MEDVIKTFLSIGYGDGYGCGSGDGSGDGYGYGDGYGCGSGDGDGCGSGDGDGYGYGDGYGDGYGCGSGDGYGDGDGLTLYNGQNVYVIDDTPTLIDSVHGQYARGSIINEDLTLTPCYIARCGDYFAHGKTLAEAVRDAEGKALENEPIDSRIDRFVATYPNADTVVNNTDLYMWHNVLTGSCEFGRKQFAKDHNIDIEHGSMSVREFIELTKNAFGCDVISQLKSKYNI